MKAIVGGCIFGLIISCIFGVGFGILLVIGGIMVGRPAALLIGAVDIMLGGGLLASVIKECISPS